MRTPNYRLVREGMGGFLNPPGHPEHNWSVQDRSGNECMSLSSAAESSYLSNETKTLVHQKLEEWEPKEPNTDWIHQVLGYFQGMYTTKTGASRSVSDLVSDPVSDPMSKWKLHAGVLLIQQYYPDYTPTPDDFKNAYWGKKQPTT